MRERILEGKEFSNSEKSWMETPYIAILQVDTLEELKVIYGEAQTEGLNPVVWKDTIHSLALDRFIPDVMVGISLGPADADKVKVVTGKLNLYR
jgi:peptidyl-tRNA hydrolase